MISHRDGEDFCSAASSGSARRFATRSPVALAMFLGAAACMPAASPRPSTISLRIRGGPPDGAVTIDEEALGSFDFVAAHGVALPPGVHHLTVEASGFFPWDRELRADAGSAPIELDVVMTPVPD